MHVYVRLDAFYRILYLVAPVSRHEQDVECHFAQR